MPSSRVTTQRLGNGGNRRSPRLTTAAAKPTVSTSRLGRRRKRDKRGSNVEQVDDDDDDDECSDKDDEIHGVTITRKGKRKDMYSTSQPLPEKSVLELVIDILQRRDTYDAFGEPVDPGKVGDYYSVVKEPMDFGTMRAKLHEGMYSNLEEFEHDAFLIPQNALLFNSPSSVYFKQAQAMEELAKKVFHLLKTEPEKLRTDFSETRRRSRRLPQEYINGKSKRGSSADDQPQHMNCRDKPPMLTSLYDDKASMRSHPSVVGGTCVNEDARSTYQPWIRFSKESDSTFSTIYRNSKLLKEVRVGNTEMQYRNSLMRFVEGLGPIAQKIAARKLQPLAKFPACTQVELQPATFKYPGLSPILESSVSTSTSTRSSMSSKFPVPSQDPFTGISTATTRDITGTEGSRVSKMSGSFF